MMPGLFAGGAGKFEVVGLQTGTSSGTTITANATVGNDGTYTELIAATANDWHAIEILISNPAVAAQQLIDVSIGAGGSELVIVADIPLQGLLAQNRGMNPRLSLPLYVAKGSRIAARVHRSSGISSTCQIALIGHNSPIRRVPSFTRATTYGTDLTNKRGTSVDPGGTANTQGTNTQIVASTTNPITALYILVTKEGTGASAAVATLLQVFIGAGGSEVSLIDEYTATETSATADNCTGGMSGIGPFLVSLPSATRLSCKARCSSTLASDRVADVTFIGLD